MGAIAAAIIQEQAKPDTKQSLESPLASRISDMHSQLAALQAEYDLLCAEVRDLARTQLADATSVDVADGTARVQVVRTGQFKPIPESAGRLLQESLGRHFAALFQEQNKATVRDLPGLLELLGDRASQYIDVKTAVAPVKGYYSRKSSLPLTSDQRDGLAEMEQLCEYSYRVVVK